MARRDRSRANKRLAVVLGVLALVFFVLGWFVTLDGRSGESEFQHAYQHE